MKIREKVLGPTSRTTPPILGGATHGPGGGLEPPCRAGLQLLDLAGVLPLAIPLLPQLPPQPRVWQRPAQRIQCIQPQGQGTSSQPADPGSTRAPRQS